MRTVYLYAAEFSNGVVKVGRSSRPEVRRIEHATPAAGLGIHILRWYQAPVVGDDLLAERAALDHCILIATSVNAPEWFNGLPFEEAVRIVEAAAASGDVANEQRRLVRGAGGPAAVARLLGISVDTVRKWDGVPPRHRRTLQGIANAPVLSTVMERTAGRLLARVQAFDQSPTQKLSAHERLLRLARPRN